jgi:hypothetical protein
MERFYPQPALDANSISPMSTRGEKMATPGNASIIT